MKKAKISSRIYAYLIDSLLILILELVIGFLILTLLNIDKGTSLFQTLPFIVIECILCPFAAITRMSETYCYILIFLFVIEFFYYLLMYSLPQQRTIGQMCANIKITSYAKLKLSKLIKRTFVLIFSRYLLYIPFVACFYNYKDQTLYDYMCSSYVIENKE